MAHEVGDGKKLWAETVDLPISFSLYVLKTVVEPVPSALPEFETGWHNTESAPIFRKWNFAGSVSSFEFGKAGFEKGAIRNDFALGRDDGTELAAARTTVKVCQRFLAGDALDGALDENLAFEILPVKDE